jgi:hypothetical protein
MACGPEHAAQLALGVKAPHGPGAIDHVLSKEGCPRDGSGLVSRPAHIQRPCTREKKRDARVDNSVDREIRSVRKVRAVLCVMRELGARLEVDLAVDEQVREADVDEVTCDNER